jgi:hypothetical protein
MVVKELVLALIIMVVFASLFAMFPSFLHMGLGLLTISAIVLMFLTKNTTLNIIGMFLIAGVIFSFMLFHGL